MSKTSYRFIKNLLLSMRRERKALTMILGQVRIPLLIFLHQKIYSSLAGMQTPPSAKATLMMILQVLQTWFFAVSVALSNKQRSKKESQKIQNLKKCCRQWASKDGRLTNLEDLGRAVCLRRRIRSAAAIQTISWQFIL
jgi:hypothetical protein